jgi:S-DNA-T family DNA segregation ATPase FtsK/SpoIIIE
MAKSQSGSIDTGPGLKHEIIGILLLAVSLYIAVCLFSDPKGSNWGGIVGDYLSGGLLTAIGYTSYIFPLLLAVISLKLILRRVVTISLAVPVSFIFFIPSFSALLTTTIETPESGGIIGLELSGFLVGYLGFTGAVIILAAVVLASILLATGTSIVHGGLALAPGLLAALQAVFSVGKLLKKSPEEAPDKNAKREKAAKDEDYPKVTVGPGIEDKGEPAIIDPRIQSPGTSAKAKKEETKTEEEHLEFKSPKGTFRLPPTALLDLPPESDDAIDNEKLLENSKVLVRKLLDFGIDGRVLEVRPGPVVTMYEFEPAPGVKVGKITSLSDDLALAMKAMSIRIIAPIPGKAVVGIEIPNRTRGAILLREIIEGQSFTRSRSRLSLALGKDISGNPYIADLTRMPHLLIAGATGTGKSVSVNAMVLSILYKATPEDVRFLMVDPKMLELSAYEGIPHLITPVITDPKRAAVALKSIVAEMGKRYRLMSMKGAKNIDMYNRLVAESGAETDTGPETGADEEEHRRLPYIVVVIDELADLMMTSGKDVEECLVRLSQMARAAGIHLLVATQRPSVDVVTGLIKTNFPARVAFQLPSRIDSRTILDSIGAETLLGEGDMLFLPPGTSKLQRIHGVFVSEREIQKVADFWKKQGTPAYEHAIMEDERGEGYDDEEDLGEEFLRRYDEAVELASTLEMISTSYLQRRFRIGYNTAARLIEKMEKEGIVGPSQGSRPREVLKRV